MIFIRDIYQRFSSEIFIWDEHQRYSSGIFIRDIHQRYLSEMNIRDAKSSKFEEKHEKNRFFRFSCTGTAGVWWARSRVLDGVRSYCLGDRTIRSWVSIPEVRASNSIYNSRTKKSKSKSPKGSKKFFFTATCPTITQSCVHTVLAHVFVLLWGQTSHTCFRSLRDFPLILPFFWQPRF